MAWQPIETAPKDGTAILVWGGQDDESMYTSGDVEKMLRGPRCVMWLLGDWLAAVADAGYRGVTYENPTHWMPLPAPPKNDT